MRYYNLEIRLIHILKRMFNTTDQSTVSTKAQYSIQSSQNPKPSNLTPKAILDLC